MSVNLSASDILDPLLFQSISDSLEEAHIEPEHLVVEVTESVLLDDPDTTMRFLSQLNAIGVKLALDDFGTRSHQSPTFAVSRSIT